MRIRLSQSIHWPRFRRALHCGLSILLGTACLASTAGALDTIYLLRHAEKQEPWPSEFSTFQPLTEAGRQRANHWSSQLADASIAAVYSSPYSRTVQTAQPIADALKAPLQTAEDSIEKDRIAAFIDELKTEHAEDVAVLVVGHSNTLPYFLRHFGADASCEDALTLHTSGKYELIEGYAGLFRVDLNKTGCDALHRETVEPASAAPAETLEDRAIHLDSTQLVAASRRYRVVYGHESMGLSETELIPGDDQLAVRQSTNIGRAGIQQEVDILRAADGSQPRTIRMQGPMGPSAADVDLSYEEGRLRGHTDFPRARQKPQGKLSIDRPLPKGTFERNALFALLPAMAIDHVAAFSLYAYDSREDLLQPIDLRVTGPLAPPERFGKEDLYRVEITGMEPGYVVWIHPQTPRHVVGITWVGQSWVYELVPGKP